MTGFNAAPPPRSAAAGEAELVPVGPFETLAASPPLPPVTPLPPAGTPNSNPLDGPTAAHPDGGSTDPAADATPKVTVIEVQNDGDGKPQPDAADLNATPPPSVPAAGDAGFLSSGFNLASTSIGAGTLGLPFAFGQAGLVPGLLFLGLSAGATVFAIHILMLLVEKTGAYSYEALGHRAFGVPGKAVVAVTVMSLLGGAGCVYVLVVGSLLVPVQELMVRDTAYPAGYWGLKLIQTLFWLVFMLPLSLLKDIDSLKVPSTIACCAVALVIIAIGIQAATLEPADRADNTTAFPATIGLGFLLTMNNIKVGFSGHTTAFPIYKELKCRSVQRMTRMTSITIALVFVLYALTGGIGLAAFGPKVKGNVLSSMADPLDHWYILVAFIAIAFTVTLSFPLVLYPCRDAIMQLIGFPSARAAPTKWRVAMSVCIATVALLIGLFTPSLTVAFGVLGGVSGNLISYGLPGVLALKLGFTPQEYGWPRVVGVWVLIVVGFVLGPAGTAAAIYDEFK